MIRRTALTLTIAATLALAVDFRPAESQYEIRKWKWMNLFGFPDCQYSCGSNVNHHNCLCFQ